jgi:hypothetical protein
MDARPDPFETALRGVLLERARGPVPSRDLLAMVDDVVASAPVRGRSRLGRGLGAAATLAASVVVIVAVGLLVGRTGGWTWALGGDGDHGPAIVWDSGQVRLEADSLRIEALGTFTGTPDLVDGAPAIRVRSDRGDAHYRTLEVEWREQGLPLRLFIYFAADDTEWWVTEMRTYDGSSRGEWIYYPGPLFRTPIGDSYVGDFAAHGQDGDVPGALRSDGMRLTAFAAGTGPAPRTGCQPWRDLPGNDIETPDDLAGMTPAQAATLLRARGVCFEFRWAYSTGAGLDTTEVWCVPPPTGIIESAGLLDDGTVVIFVEDRTGIVRVEREQPVAGWGCPTDQRGAASPGPSTTLGPSPAPPMPGGPQSITVEAEVPPTPVP